MQLIWFYAVFTVFVYDYWNIISKPITFLVPGWSVYNSKPKNKKKIRLNREDTQKYTQYSSRVTIMANFVNGLYYETEVEE